MLPHSPVDAWFWGWRPERRDDALPPAENHEESCCVPVRAGPHPALAEGHRVPSPCSPVPLSEAPGCSWPQIGQPRAVLSAQDTRQAL